jgi:subtilisin family serine protease
LISRYLASGRAQEIFPARSAKRGKKKAPPRAIIALTKSADETWTLLEKLHADTAVDSAFVAPERKLWVRKTQERAQETSLMGRGWQYAAIRTPDDLPDTSGVKIGVVDSGVDAEHPALNGLDIRKAPDPSHVDSEGHGTHVVGILGGENRPAMRRLCNSKVVMYKALGPYDPKTYYNMLRDALDECDVVNLSLGGDADDLEREILEIGLEDDRTIVVAAMGNDGDADGVQPCYPAALPGVIAVGACDHHLAHAPFSNSGDHIHVSAPGVEIYSSVPRAGSKLSKRVDYDSWEGTSMATPIVTAACAMLRAKHPDAPASLIRRMLKTQLGLGQSGWNSDLGAGIIDLEATLG